MSTTHAEFGPSTTAEEVVAAFADRVKGRVFVVTGPTPGGMGAMVLQALAAAKPQALLVVGRNPAKYTPVVTAIRAADPSIHVVVYGVDLGSLTSVRAGAEKILKENEKIDVLVNSAGVMGMPTRRLTADGIEEHFATNHIGHFLLTNLLMPALRKSLEPRVVNVSSRGHITGTGDYSDHTFANREYNWRVGYGQSKLANVQYSQELAKRVPGLVSLSAHPGVIRGTSLAQEMLAEDLADAIKRVQEMGMALKSQSQGASTLLVAALDPKAKEFNGAYLADCQITPTEGEGAKRAGAGEQLWEISESLVGQRFVF